MTIHYGRRSDAAQPAIVEELRRRGYSVILTHRAGGDAPDILVGKNGITVMVEVKSPHRLSKDKSLQARQAETRAAWRGGMFIRAWTVEQIEAAFAAFFASLASPCGPPSPVVASGA